MTTLYWVDENFKVHIEVEGTVSEELKAVLGELDGVRGGPEGNRGEYVPVRPEHSAELKEAANA